MTVLDQTSENSFVADGIVVTFAFTFRILENAHLIVTVDGVLKTEITHYTIANLTNIGGDVVFGTAPLNNEVVLVFRSVTKSQEVDYTPYDAFPAETHERALDKLTMISQDNSGGIININAKLPAGAVENSFMRWNDVTKVWEEFTAYILPLADGTDGQIMVTNGAGVLSFENQSGGEPPASAIVRKISTADESISSDTVAAHTELSAWALVTGKLYSIRGKLWCRAQFSSGGFRCQPYLSEVPDDTHRSHTRSHGVGNFADAFDDINTLNGWNSLHNHPNLGNAAVFLLELEMLIIANTTDGGTFDFRFGQITAGANAVTVFKGSFIEVEQLD